jgi:NADPH:quinone reductase-like Zn-dependent oxidoreductase
LTFNIFINMAHHTASSADLAISSLFDVKNHVVLVTGGATGLGEMAAQAFIQNGAKVFIASRKEKELKTVCMISPSESFTFVVTCTRSYLNGLN